MPPPVRPAAGQEQVGGAGQGAGGGRASARAMTSTWWAGVGGKQWIEGWS
jgi:hypothetical protein